MQTLGSTRPEHATGVSRGDRCHRSQLPSSLQEQRQPRDFNVDRYHPLKASAILLQLPWIQQRPSIDASPAHCTISDDNDKTCIIFFATCYAAPKWSNGTCTNCLMKHQGLTCSNSRITPISCDVILTMVDESTPHRLSYYGGFGSGADGDRDGGLSVELEDGRKICFS